MFKRPHHQRIDRILNELNGDLLRDHQCYFGGGTALALRYGEYRESSDIDLLVSDRVRFLELRSMVKRDGLLALGLREACSRVTTINSGAVRGFVAVDGIDIKFEIVHEDSVAFAEPSFDDRISGITHLIRTDALACKLNANSTRGVDTRLNLRDVLDITMMQPTATEFLTAEKSLPRFCHDSVRKAFDSRTEELIADTRLLRECMRALSMDSSTAAALSRIRQARNRHHEAVGHALGTPHASRRVWVSDHERSGRPVTGYWRG